MQQDLVNEFERPIQAVEARPASAPTRQVSFKVQHWAGPLPPPQILAEYNQVSDGFADRIVTQFEEQGRHRRKLENRVVTHNMFSSTVAQVMAFILLAGTIAGGVYLALHDKPFPGIAAVITAVGGAAYVLKKAGVARAGNLAEKREQEKKGLQKR